MDPPIGGGVSTDFKSSNRIKISWLVQILLNFYWFKAPQPPRGVGSGWGGYLRGWGWCGNLLDDVGMTWGWQGRCGDDGDDVGTTGTTCGDHRDHGDHRPWGPHGDLLGLWGWCGDNGYDVGMTGTMWGWRGDDGGTTGTTKSLKRP